MTPDEHAKILRAGHGDSTHLQALLALAKRAPGVPADALRTRIRQEVALAKARLNNEHFDRQVALEQMVASLEHLAGAAPTKATVILFKPSGKYYTEEEWRIPELVGDWSPSRGHYKREPIGPYDMEHSPDFRRIDGGAVLVPEQEPWGYPHLFPALLKP